MIDKTDNIIKSRQEYGRIYAAKKLPSWAFNNLIEYPEKLPLEQCSSEDTAKFKASLINGDLFADLCGGFGVDSVFLSRRFHRGIYVEQNEELFHIAKNNFVAMQCTNIECFNSTAEKYLKNIAHCDLIYLDPARRTKTGKKTVLIENCSPNIIAIKHELLSVCNTLMLKLSPLLDIKAALTRLPETRQVYVISVKNECKELLLLLGKNTCNNPEIKCIDLPHGEIFSFLMNEESDAQITYGPPLSYIYEPASSIMKSGAFKSISLRYGLQKLHINSHLYTSEKLIDDFPGKKFKIIATHPAKASYCKDIKQANLSVRNFPGKTDDLKKKLKIKDGGVLHLFATTINDNRHMIIRCSKI